MSDQASYVRAAGRFAPTRLYDPVMALTMRESAWRTRLVDELLAGGAVQRVLDVGCGTGTLAVEIASRAPRAEVVGVDGDGAVLASASAKANAAGVDIELREALATALPLEDASFDRASASLLLHHLAPRDKTSALTEMRRVLRPGGRLVVADWGRGPDPLMRAVFLGLRVLDGFENTAAHASGELPGLIEAAGFSPVRRVTRWRTVWGALELLVASKPHLRERVSLDRKPIPGDTFGGGWAT